MASTEPQGSADDGTEPDPRFTFANERTFLAWIRTALALLAAGISLDTFVTKFPEALRTAVSILLVLTGAACGGLAYRRWMARSRTPSPSWLTMVAPARMRSKLWVISNRPLL